MTPQWILDVFAAVTLIVAAVAAVRLTAGSSGLTASSSGRHAGSGADVDLAHVLMGIAMAGTLADSLRTLPDGAWEAAFAVSAVWFGWRVVRDARASGIRALARGHCAPHLVHSAAMTYMFAALPAAGAATMGSAGTAGVPAQSLGYPTLAFVFALALAGYSVWDLDQLSVRRFSPAAVPASAVPAGASVLTGTAPVAASSVRGIAASPAVTVGCRIAMGVTMAFMLIVMI